MMSLSKVNGKVYRVFSVLGNYELDKIIGKKYLLGERKVIMGSNSQSSNFKKCYSQSLTLYCLVVTKRSHSYLTKPAAESLF